MASDAAYRDPDRDVREFHAHVYFSPATRDSAAGLRAHLAAQASLGLVIHPMRDGRAGPHLVTMFGVDIPKASLPTVLGFLMLNHGPHSVLVHPVTSNEVQDHSVHALWLGSPQPLDLSVLT